MLGGLVLAALIYAPLAALEWRSAQQDRYVEAMTERAAAELAERSARRILQSASDQSAIEDMRTWGLAATNIAVAQVQLEQRLVETIERVGLTNANITTDPEVETIGGTQWLGAQVQADLRWTPTFAFLDALTGWPEGFRVTRFQYDQTRSPMPGQIPSPDMPTGRVTIGLAVPVILEDASVAP